ncbi:MAG: hypothetical protein ACR2QC_11985 [Gammaproteobacteria bacterium]
MIYAAIMLASVLSLTPGQGLRHSAESIEVLLVDDHRVACIPKGGQVVPWCIAVGDDWVAFNDACYCFCDEITCESFREIFKRKLKSSDLVTSGWRDYQKFHRER